MDDHEHDPITEPEQPVEASEAPEDEEEAFDAERAAELVHARYTGDTEVVMPDLAGRPRCCDKDNHRDDDPSGAPNPHTVLRHGDVILLDRWSAEGRADFEVIDAEINCRVCGKPYKTEGGRAKHEGDKHTAEELAAAIATSGPVSPA